MNACLTFKFTLPEVNSMQVQKDDVRNKIIAAATEEFLTAGYQQ